MGRTIQAVIGAPGVEQIQDSISTMIADGGGVTWTYNDGANTLTPAVDHGGVGGLADDDHTGYARLDGRATGQIFYGGTAASETLRLDGTSHATPGVVYTLTSNVGVGIVPTTTLHVNAAAVASAGILVQGSSSPRIRITETGSTVHLEMQADGAAGYVGTGSNHAVHFRANNTSFGILEADGDFGFGTTTADRRFHVEQDSAATNTVTYVGRFTSTSTGTPAAGIGVGLEFEVETADGNNEIGATIEVVATDVTSTSEDFALDFNLMTAGAAAATLVRFRSDGIFGFNTTDLEVWQSAYRAIHLGATANLMYQNSGTGVLLNNNTYYDGSFKYRTTAAVCQINLDTSGAFNFNAAASGTIDTAVSLTNHLQIGNTGGVTVGAPTGGNKGAGTINATAVYDDNVLLTCYVLDQALDGAINIANWDAKVPPRVIKDIAGNVLSTEVRQHDPLRKFAARIGTAYDPLDLDKFWQHIVDKRHLTAYPNETNYDAVNGKQDVGSWQQQTIELLEIYAVHIKKLNDRLKALGG